MSAPSCKYFDGCSAPLCPLDPQSMTHVSWFPDEATCTRADLKMTPWIARQRKIARVTARDFAAGAFTHGMLSHDITIRHGLTGLDPDKGPPDRTETDWMKAHPERRQLSDEERAVLRARVAKSGALSSGRRSPESSQSRAQMSSATVPVSEAGGGPV
ncbi:MAG: hypothetical protein ABSF77_06505 [Spirochaetia bacterium]|jgi:hypothetical protein